MPRPQDPSRPPISDKEKERNKKKQRTYFEKIKKVPQLEDEIKQLRATIENKLKDSLSEAEIDYRLKERGRPERKQPGPDLAKDKRASFMQTERLRHKRDLFEWLSERQSRLQDLLDNLNETPATTVYKKDDLDSIFDDLFDTEEDSEI
jgi:hypothetical protein